MGSAGVGHAWYSEMAMEVAFFYFHIPDRCSVFSPAEVWSLSPLANEMVCPARSVPPTLTRLIPSNQAGEQLDDGLGVQGYC